MVREREEDDYFLEKHIECVNCRLGSINLPIHPLNSSTTCLVAMVILKIPHTLTMSFSIIDIIILLYKCRQTDNVVMSSGSF